MKAQKERCLGPQGHAKGRGKAGPQGEQSKRIKDLQRCDSVKGRREPGTSQDQRWAWKAV